MLEKRNKRLLISLVMLVVSIALVAWLATDKEKKYVNKDLFKVADLKTIDRVELQSGKDKVVLSFNGTRWLVNDSLIADRDMVDVLFATLLQAEPKRPVSERMKDSVATQLANTGVRVSLLEKGVVQKNFTAGGNEGKTVSYFKDEAGNVFMMVIPGYRVYVSGIFELSESSWRDKFVFGFNWTNFKSLRAEFPKQSSGNFEVSNENGVFAVQGIATDTAKLNDFLDAVSLLTVDEYLKEDTLTKHEALMKIVVNDVAGRRYELTVLAQHTAGRTACLLRNGSLCYIDSRKLNRIVRRREFFGKLQN